MKKTRWCIVGAGGIADRRTIPALLKDESNVIVAVMDRFEEVAEKIGKKYGVKYYSNEDRMLEENECDAVYIGTPVMCHYEQAVTALRYGADVFVEKPLCCDAKQGKELVDLFKRMGKQLTVGYMMKYHNLHVKARDMIKNGKIGEVTDVRLQFSCWYPEIRGAWRQTKSLSGGGAIMDLGVHCIELAEYVLDEEIVETKGFTNRKIFRYEVEDCAVIAFKTASGVLGHIDVNFNIPDYASESKFEIYGSKGYIICTGTLGQEEVGKMSYLYAPQGDYDAQQSRASYKPTVYYGAKGDIYLKQIKSFCKIVKTGKPDYTFADRAVQVQKVVDEIYSQNQ